MDEHRLRFHVPDHAKEDANLQQIAKIMKDATRQAFYDIAINVAGDNDEIMTLVGEAMANGTDVDERVEEHLKHFPEAMAQVRAHIGKYVVAASIDQSHKTQRRLRRQAKKNT